MKSRLLLLLACCIPFGAAADVEMRFSDGSTILVGDGRVLFGDNANSVLFVPGRDGVVMLNRERQTYIEMKPGFADAIAEEAAARREQMLASMTPEQRALVEDEITTVDTDRRFTINRTGNNREIAGYDCHEAEIVDGNGQTKEIVCIATADELGISGDDFQSLTGFMVKLAEIAAVAPDDDSFIELGRLGGVPVRTEDIDYGTTSELLSISEAQIDEERLEIPDDYTEISTDTLLTQ